jgi:hypothetical protein
MKKVIETKGGKVHKNPAVNEEINALKAKISELEALATNRPKGVYQYLDVYIGHITKRDDGLLNCEDFPCTVYPYEDGYFVFVDLFLEDENEFRDFGMSPNFIALLQRATDLGCWWLRLDSAGTEFEEFEMFDW